MFVSVVLFPMLYVVAAESTAHWDSATKVYTNGDLGGQRGELTDVPDDIPPDAEEVYLWNNQMEVLQPGRFSHLGVCRKLELRANLITSIASQTFKGMKSLEELMMLANKIRTISDGAFLGLDKLYLLDLQHQRNGLTALHPGIFIGIPLLKILFVNSLEINRIEETTFRNMSALNRVTLGYNKLESLPPFVFSYISSQSFEVTLHNNQLTTLPWTLFGVNHPAQLRLDLSGNPMQCDCALWWLKKGEQEGWISFLRTLEGEIFTCANTGKQWSQVTLSCDHLSK